MIDKSKQYRTRDGREVRIYATDGTKNFPVHGAILADTGWASVFWTETGGHYFDNAVSNHDLIEVRPRIKRDLWVNVYEGGIVNFRYTRADADDDATSDRIACVRLTIDCEEGEGL